MNFYVITLWTGKHKNFMNVMKTDSRSPHFAFLLRGLLILQFLGYLPPFFFSIHSAVFPEPATLRLFYFWCFAVNKAPLEL